MPIRPENRARYPKDWPAISRRIRNERAQNRCERCGVANKSARINAVGLPVVIVLTVAHLNHQPEDCRDENLLALCQRCHNQHDAKTRAAGIKQRRRAGAAVGDLLG